MIVGFSALPCDISQSKLRFYPEHFQSKLSTEPNQCCDDLEKIYGKYYCIFYTEVVLDYRAHLLRQGKKQSCNVEWVYYSECLEGLSDRQLVRVVHGMLSSQLSCYLCFSRLFVTTSLCRKYTSHFIQFIHKSIFDHLQKIQRITYFFSSLHWSTVQINNDGLDFGAFFTDA